MRLGELIREARESKQIDKQELAELISVRIEHLQKIERNESLPNYPTLRRLAESLDLSYEEMRFVGRYIPKRYIQDHPTALKLIQYLEQEWYDEVKLRQIFGFAKRLR